MKTMRQTCIARALLSRAWETAAALRAVANLKRSRDDGERDLGTAAKGFLFILEAPTSLLESDAPMNAVNAARRKVARLEAVAHRDPIYRVVLALRGFKAALDTVLARQSGHRTAKGLDYTVGLLAQEWEALSDGYLSKEAEKREFHRLIGLIGAHRRATRAAA